jgi:hypothetical protein
MSVINEETASVGIVGGADATHDCKLKHMLTAAANNNNNDNNIDFEKLTCECKNQMEAKKAVLGQHMGKASAVMKNQNQNLKQDNVFTLKRWNLVTMWSWDVECEVCAICRTPLMGETLFSSIKHQEILVFKEKFIF